MLSFLLALGERDWFHCFAHAGAATPPPLPSIFAPAELTPVLLETVMPPFSHWLNPLFYFGPFAIFAVLFLFARTLPAHVILAAVFALFLLFCLWRLLPPAALHACDANGPGDLALLIPILFAGLFAGLVARRIGCSIGVFY